jgi:hypothetical protein
VNSKIVAILMISGFLFSASSVYLNNLVFADDNWSDITKRQQSAEQRAIVTFQSKYQFANMNGSMIDWSGLSSTPTESTSRERNLDAQAKVSLDNALADFGKLYSNQQINLQFANYSGLGGTTTNMTGRDRTAMLEQEQITSLANAGPYLNGLYSIQATYVNSTSGDVTDESTFDRQATIQKNLGIAEQNAADSVSSLSKINQGYLNLNNSSGGTNFVYQPGSVTNEMTVGRQLSPGQAYAIEKAIIIFNQIHDKHLAMLNSNYYGLSNTPTDSEGRDRSVMLQQAKDASLSNALRVYNAYYNGWGLK